MSDGLAWGGAESPPGLPTRVGAGIRIDDVSHWFGDDPEPAVLQDIDVDLAAGEFLTIVGPSGCGKSTLLNLVAGFALPKCGEIRVDGEPVQAPSADRGMVFQQARLFSWMRVFENVTFGPRVNGLGKRESDRVANEALALVGLSGSKEKWPHELSGGMQQRVAIARALAARPRILLMDEPFAALDALTRERLQDETLDIWKRTGMTVIFVTHSVDEAAYLSTRIIALDRNPGRVAVNEQAGFGAVRDRSGLRSSPQFLALRDQLHEVVVKSASD